MDRVPLVMLPGLLCDARLFAPQRAPLERPDAVARLLRLWLEA
jgi:hypothetical protein